jgi:hypothetical protein
MDVLCAADKTTNSISMMETPLFTTSKHFTPKPPPDSIMVDEAVPATSKDKLTSTGSLGNMRGLVRHPNAHGDTVSSYSL